MLGLTLDSLGPPTVLFLLDGEQNTLFHLCQFFSLAKNTIGDVASVTWHAIILVHLLQSQKIILIFPPNSIRSQWFAVFTPTMRQRSQWVKLFIGRCRQLVLQLREKREYTQTFLLLPSQHCQTLQIHNSGSRWYLLPLLPKIVDNRAQ